MGWCCTCANGYNYVKPCTHVCTVVLLCGVVAYDEDQFRPTRTMGRLCDRTLPTGLLTELVAKQPGRVGNLTTARTGADDDDQGGSQGSQPIPPPPAAPVAAAVAAPVAAAAVA